jgi:uncharacterized oligopeptide transporter (OPT) family protein
VQACLRVVLAEAANSGFEGGLRAVREMTIKILSVVVLSFFLSSHHCAAEANLATGGIGGRLLPAPQAGLMATLSQGIVGGQMAWGLVAMGAILGIIFIMIQAPATMLIAVGMYLPLETTGAICAGGVIRWVADQWAARSTD